MDKYNYTIYGTFKVTTEGDCEGKTTKYLGMYTGYIDEIALTLADKCGQSLTFHQIFPETLKFQPKRKEVRISFYFDSGVYNFRTAEEKFNYFKELFKDRDVVVDDAGWSCGCILKSNAKTLEEKRAEILAKLTDEEKEILGLN